MELIIKIKRSLVFAVFLFIVHLSALVGVMLLSSAVYLKVLWLIVLLVSFVLYLNKYILQNTSGSVVQIDYSKLGVWNLLTAHDDVTACELDTSYLSRWCVILRFKTTRRFLRINVPIFFDAVDAQQWRLLRQHILTARGGS